MSTDKDYWFPAKRYGWGWGLPIRWQGWLVFVGYLAALVASAFLFPPRQALGLYLVSVAAISVALFGLCWLKGEPPRWRWGDNDPQ